MSEGHAESSGSAPPGDFRLGELRVFVCAGRIEGPGGAEQVDPKVMAVLERLARDAGAPVSREALLDSVWEGRIVSDDAVSRCVYQLRRHLAGAGGSPKFRRLIRTLPKRGYLLQGEILALDEAPAAPAAAPVMLGARRGFRARLAGLAFTLALAAGLAWWISGQSAPRPAPAAGETTSAPPTIAVLPFVDLSAEQDQAYLADGISEEIIGLLASHRELRVIGRTSSFALRDSRLGSREITDLLGARFLLEGSLRKDGEQLRISTQLVDQDGVHLWGATFDRSLDQIFDIQAEIARVVATSIVPQVAPTTYRPRQPEIDAYREYLVGWDLLSRRAEMYYDVAPDHFTRAIEIDPAFAGAYAARAIGLFFRSRIVGDHDAQVAQALRDVDTAIELDPLLGKAYAAKALLMERTDPDKLREREALLRRALELDPSLPDAWNWLAGVLLAQERVAESLDALLEGSRRNPLAPAINVNLAGREAPQEAIRRLERLLRVPQQSHMVSSRLVELYLGSGEYAKALDVARRLMLEASSAASRTDWSGPLVSVYARLGMRDEARYWLERHAAEAPASHFPLVLQALYRARDALGHAETLARFRAVMDAAGTGPEHLPFEARVRYAVLLALAGEHAGAIAVLEPALARRGDRPVMIQPEDIEAHQVLAWSLLQTGRADLAREILHANEALLAGEPIPARREFGETLAVGALNALLLGDLASARRRLEHAFAAGWRDPSAVAHDPRWDRARTDPAMARLLETAAADVARQRRALELAEDPAALMAQVDAVISASRRADIAR